DRHRRLELLVPDAADPFAMRKLRDDSVLDLRELLVFRLEVADELLSAVLLETVAADAALRFPFRPILPDQIEDPVFQLLGGRQRAALHPRIAQRTAHLRHAVVS